jgi:hypothetical protein
MSRHARVLVGMTLIASALLVWGCTSRRGPERTVLRFFHAMNDKDVNLLLTCFDPRQERLFRATFRLVEKATGFPITDVFELLPGLNQAFGGQAPEDFRFSQVRVVSRDIDGTSARLGVTVRATYRTGGRESVRTEHLEFLLEKFDEDGWRIIGVRQSI